MQCYWNQWNPAALGLVAATRGFPSARRTDAGLRKNYRGPPPFPRDSKVARGFFHPAEPLLGVGFTLFPDGSFAADCTK